MCMCSDHRYKYRIENKKLVDEAISQLPTHIQKWHLPMPNVQWEVYSEKEIPEDDEVKEIDVWITFENLFDINKNLTEEEYLLERQLVAMVVSFIDGYICAKGGNTFLFK